ncbi:uncharacterized protein LOC143021160 [Oratosquilla oratoria]|uniref:uncharacterized protein LOC143021160 n=1 Tax=Oratosquilla oratoria TaxID=337810 RepID=UPI003F767F69
MLNPEPPIDSFDEAGPMLGDTIGEEEPPTRAEVQNAIMALKNNKAPGNDMLNAEILKAGSDIPLTELTELVGLIWTQEEIPDGINEAIIGALHDKGDQTFCEHIFTLRQVLEKRWEYAQDFHTVFVDFKQTYDCIHRESLLKVIAILGIPSKLIRLIQTLYNSTSSRVRVSSDDYIWQSRVKELAYADDVVILAEDMRSLDLAFCELVRATG